MQHLVLLGDSIFDNRSYVSGGLAVIDQVRNHLPKNWQASLAAVDGDVTSGIIKQMQPLPNTVSHLAMSIGGNDALIAIDQLHRPTKSVMGALQVLTDIQKNFLQNYQQAVKAATGIGKPLLVCTIYEHIPGLASELRTALSLFNDVIISTAVQNGLPILDLRAICTEVADYSVISPIEPSSAGGDKIAKALVQAIQYHDFDKKLCRIYR